MKLEIIGDGPPTVHGRYRTVTDQKAGGATYTPKALADFVAKRIVEASKHSKLNGTLRLLDPATGDGELLYSLLEQLEGCENLDIQVYGYETDESALRAAEARLRGRFQNAELHLTLGNFLTSVGAFNNSPASEDLFAVPPKQLFDLIIANPPYVRTQIMGAEQAQSLARQFGLTGRVDLYYAFIIGMAQVLRAGGVAGVIVSNRFMTTKSGAAVRQAIRERFYVRHVWDLGDTRLFEAAVLPAVLLVEKLDGQERRSAGFTSIYETSKDATDKAQDVISALSSNGIIEISDGRRFAVNTGTLDITSRAEAVWRNATNEADGWLSTVESYTWKRFGDIGKIRVGVKTTADKVFIRTDWTEMVPDELPELLQPLTTHHVARRFRAGTAKKPRQILYPHETVDGRRRAVDLAQYPRAAAYLDNHRGKLEARTYVIEAGRKWYEIWVPQEPSTWKLPKLVFRDISEQPTFWLDLAGTIVNGDCYWLAAEKSEDTEHLWLAAAVANSTFIEAFYDHSFNNKLYSGRRRFITQYVERFPLPDPLLASSMRIADLSKQIYHNVDTDVARDIAVELDQLIWAAFGVPLKKIAG